MQEDSTEPASRRPRCESGALLEQVRLAALPAQIPLQTADAVLFVGKAARVLRDSNIGSGSAGGAGQWETGSSGGGAESKPRGGGAAAWRPEADGLETALQLQRLATQPPFDRLAFQSVVETSRKQVGAAV